MNTANIMVFIGLCLDKKPVSSLSDVQRFIMNHDDVKKAIAIEDIQEAIWDLVYAGFIKETYQNGESHWRKA
jgi:hypothetical protein